MVDEEPKAEPAAVDKPIPAPEKPIPAPEEKPEEAAPAALAPEEKPDKVREWSLAVGLMFALALVFWTLLRYLRTAMGP